MRRKLGYSDVVRALLVIVGGILFVYQPALADPSKYPQFAQQKLPADVTPAFISIDQLLAEVKAGTKPVIIDVRSGEEFKEAHILGSISAPINDFRSYIESIPKDRLLVLY